MLITFNHTGTYFSKLSLPSDTAIYDNIIDFHTEMKKLAKRCMELKIVSSILFVNIYDNKKIEILKTQTIYTLETDNRFKDFEIYKAFQHSLFALKQGLLQQDKERHILDKVDVSHLTLANLRMDTILPIIRQFEQI